MRSEWTTFEGRPYQRTADTDPRVTVSSRNVLYLNTVAVTALGNAAAVELQYDGHARRIALRPCDPRKANAFPLVPHGRRYTRVNAAAFFQHFRLKFRATELFLDVENDNGRLVLDLNKTTTVRRGAR